MPRLAEDRKKPAILIGKARLQSVANTAKRKPHTAGLACAALFQEQIQGPENASIARFDGLCRYQTDSEK